MLPVVTKAEEMMMAAAENKEYLPVQVGVLRSARPRYLLAYPVSNGPLRPGGAASAIASFWQPPAVCVCPVVLSTC